jgi:putative salt-induced outer membrane protein YdiY
MTILALAFLFSQTANAFLNIEDIRQKTKQDYAGSVNVDWAMEQGNAEKSRTGLQTLNVFRKESHEFLIVGNYKYGESRGEKDQNEGTAHIRYARWLTTRLAGEFFIQRRTNEFQDLFYRQLYGTGLRYNLFTDEDTSLFFGAGAFYEDEKLSSGTRNKDSRGNVYLSYLDQVSPVASLSVVLYYQPNTDDFEDYRLNLAVGLSSAINTRFSINLNMDFRYDSLPPVGVQTRDTSYSAGLAYKF